MLKQKLIVLIFVVMSSNVFCSSLSEFKVNFTRNIQKLLVKEKDIEIKKVLSAIIDKNINDDLCSEILIKYLRKQYANQRSELKLKGMYLKDGRSLKDLPRLHFIIRGDITSSKEFTKLSGKVLDYFTILQDCEEILKSKVIFQYYSDSMLLMNLNLSYLERKNKSVAYSLNVSNVYLLNIKKYFLDERPYKLAYKLFIQTAQNSTYLSNEMKVKMSKEYYKVYFKGTKFEKKYDFLNDEAFLQKYILLK